MTCSASQVVQWDRCQRKWGWRYLDGIKVDRPARTLGTEVHAIVEAWLRDATPPPSTEAGRIAEQAIAVLPAPKTPGLRLEEPFEIVMAGITWRGVKDVESIGVIYDLKSTKDKKYSLKAEELHTDPQAALYAAESMSWSGLPDIDLRWVYVLTKAKRKRPAHVVEAVVTRDQIAPTLERMVKVAHEMQRVRADGKRALDLVPNPFACGDYGGCEYRDRCGELSMTTNLDDLLASLSKVPPAINPPAPSEAPTIAPKETKRAETIVPPAQSTGDTIKIAVPPSKNMPTLPAPAPLTAVEAASVAVEAALKTIAAGKLDARGVRALRVLVDAHEQLQALG